MKFEKVALEAIRQRAAMTRERVMTIEQISLDLGYPADFEDVVEALHAHGHIILHRYSETLTLAGR